MLNHDLWLIWVPNWLFALRLRWLEATGGDLSYYGA